jgi:hypothetical protein
MKIGLYTRLAAETASPELPIEIARVAEQCDVDVHQMVAFAAAPNAARSVASWSRSPIRSWCRLDRCRVKDA